jgi:hypothetical protein
MLAIKPVDGGTRFAAYAIDVVLLIVLNSIVTFALLPLFIGDMYDGVLSGGSGRGFSFWQAFSNSMNSMGPYAAVGSIVQGLIYCGFLFVPEGLWGISLGKKMLGLQIASQLDGSTQRLWQRSLIKNLSGPVTILSGLMMLVAGGFWLSSAIGFLMGLYGLALFIIMIVGVASSPPFTVYDNLTKTGVYRKKDLENAPTESQLI